MGGISSNALHVFLIPKTSLLTGDSRRGKPRKGLFLEHSENCLRRGSQDVSAPGSERFEKESKTN